ncbi:alkaline phosphatase PafA [Niabella yanshanensis]|uniref:Alkaline phosphatase PafA n=1 Tax=Niabella yanshanensis TaxID=577386 RepID=A0ABZ0W498_9BACT|nr:alkaline phosphatase PafA [Niabella yanshanensis]WQD37936.1 alkaline phosphatase PafA [Niabella yanshanensis]
MKRSLLSILFLIIAFAAFAQPVKRPKLVVGLVIDQMRWDYLYRYYDRYEATGGFKRMLNEGFSCENTFINYIPSYTAIGHTTVFTGSVPALHGIAGNNWIDQASGKNVYCTDDSTVQGVGSNSSAGKMSPRNLLATTITDELRLATNFQSKVIGVSLKDRASILPAGHNPTGAFWFDDVNGDFITSTWYMNELPKWVKDFNAKDEPGRLTATPWTTLYPINTYKQSTADDVKWEGKFKGETTTAFPHHLKDVYKTDKDVIRSSPYGNTLTLDFAKAAIEGNNLGGGTATDFLTINCASTDYVGHKYGPNSIEIEDVYLRLDRELGAFYKYLDQKLGKGNYLVFLTADHGAAHAINFMKEYKMPAEFLELKKITTSLNDALKAQFGAEKIVLSNTNYQINFNKKVIKEQKLDYDAIKKASLKFLKDVPELQFVIDVENIGAEPVPEVVKQMTINGYNNKRSGTIQLIPYPAWFEGGYGGTGTTHGTWNPHDTHIPLVWMGWGIKPGKSNREVYMTDIAPTVAALLRIQMPNGAIGKPITEVTQ